MMAAQQMRLGELLVQQKLVNHGDLNQALERQKTVGGTLGDNLVAMGKVTPDQIGSVLHQTPQAPKSVDDTGLSNTFLLSLALKTMRVYGAETPSQVAAQMKLPIGIVEVLLENARQRSLVDSLGPSSSGPLAEIRWGLTDKGRAWAMDALEQSQYVGPAPVPLATFAAQVQRQRITHERIGPDRLAKSFAELILPAELVRELGPAANSGQAMLLYGPPGNGKTSIAVAMGAAYHDPIYIPYAIEIDGQVVKIFDPVFHQPVAESAEAAKQPAARIALVRSATNDERWVRCKRPVVVTGGELSLEMLDLSFDQVSKFYEAPLQLKATGGIFVLDDFGRQLVSPQDILNRWVIPLERRIDYLTLHTGKKFPVPFDELVVFSTNFVPTELMDAAMMRRVPYKIPVEPPSEEDFSKIFRKVAKANGLDPVEPILAHLAAHHYSRENRLRARHHPKFIVEYTIAMCRFEGVPPRLDTKLVDDAMRHLYAAN